MLLTKKAQCLNFRALIIQYLKLEYIYEIFPEFNTLPRNLGKWSTFITKQNGQLTLDKATKPTNCFRHFSSILYDQQLRTHIKA